MLSRLAGGAPASLERNEGGYEFFQQLSRKVVDWVEQSTDDSSAGNSGGGMFDARRGVMKPSSLPWTLEALEELKIRDVVILTHTDMPVAIPGALPPAHSPTPLPMSQLPRTPVLDDSLLVKVELRQPGVHEQFGAFAREPLLIVAGAASDALSSNLASRGAPVMVHISPRSAPRGVVMKVLGVDGDGGGPFGPAFSYVVKLADDRAIVVRAPDLAAAPVPLMRVKVDREAVYKQRRRAGSRNLAVTAHVVGFETDGRCVVRVSEDADGWARSDADVLVRVDKLRAFDKDGEPTIKFDRAHDQAFAIGDVVQLCDSSTTATVSWVSGVVLVSETASTSGTARLSDGRVVRISTMPGGASESTIYRAVRTRSDEPVGADAMGAPEGSADSSGCGWHDIEAIARRAKALATVLENKALVTGSEKGTMGEEQFNECVLAP
jgi:hypothetical protein